MSRILIIDDEAAIRSSTEHILRTMNYEVFTASTCAEGIAFVNNEKFDLVISDLLVPEIKDGLAIIQAVKAQEYPPAILIMSVYDSTDNVVEAMRAGADDFIKKGFTVKELQIRVEKLLNLYQREREHEIEKRLLNQHLKRRFGDFKIVGKSQKITELIWLIDKVASFGKVTCLIEGETGTGKELAAREIHRRSSRQNRLFVDVNCAGVPEQLLENELFGHDRGAYTGASSIHQGKFEWADGGVLFLDEISELKVRSQAKLLRVIEEGKFSRLGSNKPITADVMIITATNKNLARLVQIGKFRKDLYYRLNVVKIHTPPLREHLEDISLLVDLFISQLNNKYLAQKSVSDEVISMLHSHQFPGNVRELKNILENAYIQADKDVIGKKHLQIEPMHLQSQNPEREMIGLTPLKKAVQNYEKDYVIKALERNFWNITRTAASLGVTREGLTKKMKRLNIRK